MADRAETVLAALFTALPAPVNGEKLRNRAAADELPPGGLIVLRDGSKGDPVEEYLNPPAAVFRHAAELQLIFQSADDAARSAGIAALADLVKAAIAADRTLGGLVDYVELRRGDGRDEPETGAAAIRVEDATIILEYLEDQ